MITFNSGDIALVRFPFTDQTTVKQRPAVIVNRDAYPRLYGDFVLIPLTSQAQPDAEMELLDWKAAGLLRPTWAKPVIATVHGRLIVKVIGTLAAADHRVVRALIKEVFAERWLTP